MVALYVRHRQNYCFDWESFLIQASGDDRSFRNVRVSCTLVRPPVPPPDRLSCARLFVSLRTCPLARLYAFHLDARHPTGVPMVSNSVSQVASCMDQLPGIF